MFRLPLLLAAATLAFSGASFAVTPIDRILVVVNESVILQSEFEAALADARAQLRQRGVQNVPEVELRDQVLERLVLMRLQRDRAEQAGIRVDDRELNDVLTDIARRSGLTLNQFSEQLRAEGGDYLRVREQIREEIITQRLRARELEPRINITDADIDAWLAQQDDLGDTEVRLSHILVALGDGVAPDERAAARQRIAELRQRVIDGEDFATIAAAHSDGQTALEGGDLGWRRLADLPPAFAKATAELSPGEVSPVIDAAGGFHLLRLEESRGGEQQKIVTETRARHILIAPDQILDETAARALALDLSRRLRENEDEDFAALARRYSSDPGSKNDGGNLGWVAPGTMVDVFHKEVDKLEIGEISRPFRSEFGWHVVEVLDRRQRDITEEVRRRKARQAIGERKMADEYELWLRRLRDEAFIEYRLGDA